MPNVYTTQEKVLDELPNDLPATVKDKIPGWIEDESGNIDTALPNYNTPFADIAGTPKTPTAIEKIARYLVLDRACRKLGLLRYDEDGKPTESYKTEAERLIRRLKDGDDVIPASQLS